MVLGSFNSGVGLNHLVDANFTCDNGAAMYCGSGEGDSACQNTTLIISSYRISRNTTPGCGDQPLWKQGSRKKLRHKECAASWPPSFPGLLESLKDVSFAIPADCLSYEIALLPIVSKEAQNCGSCGWHVLFQKQHFFKVAQVSWNNSTHTALVYRVSTKPPSACAKCVYRESETSSKEQRFREPGTPLYNIENVTNSSNPCRRHCSHMEWRPKFFKMGT